MELYRGIEIRYKDGSFDWYDPVEPDGINVTETDVEINNGYHDYSIPKDKIRAYVWYEKPEKKQDEDGIWYRDDDIYEDEILV